MTEEFAGRRVLLAEDDAAARRVLAGSLRGMGLDVSEVADGGRMLVAITAQYRNGRTPFDLDLIITDVRMPVMNGLEAFKGVRAARWSTPVIIVTAFETAEVRDVVERFDATLLIKPFDLDLFEDAVRRALARRALGTYGRR